MSILHIVKNILIFESGFGEKSYMELHGIISYIEAPCMAFLNILLDIDPTRATNILREVVFEDLFICQYQACSYVPYLLLRSLDNLDLLTLTVGLMCAQDLVLIFHPRNSLSCRMTKIMSPRMQWSFIETV